VTSLSGSWPACPIRDQEDAPIRRKAPPRGSITASSHHAASCGRPSGCPERPQRGRAAGPGALPGAERPALIRLLRRSCSRHRGVVKGRASGADGCLGGRALGPQRGRRGVRSTARPARAAREPARTEDKARPGTVLCGQDVLVVERDEPTVEQCAQLDTLTGPAAPSVTGPCSRRPRTWMKANTAAPCQLENLLPIHGRPDSRIKPCLLLHSLIHRQGGSAKESRIRMPKPQFRTWAGTDLPD
jgi:hypothetical protein